MTENSFFPDYQMMVLDLDNTIIREMDYLNGAYKQIASLLSEGAKYTTSHIYSRLLCRFTKYGRKMIFDRVCSDLELNASRYIPKCLEILRTVDLLEPLKLEDWVPPSLDFRHFNGLHSTVLTNGNPTQQMNKYKQIDWQQIPIPFLCLANNLRPKPFPDGIFWIMDLFDVTASEIIFVGDSEVDRKAAAKAGTSFIHPAELR